ncbi:glycosyl hydrolase family 28-related protein [Pedobacter sp.]|uniref:glycosyl hydrolase family 28-related protein n=1 Tax=Pedobacter sp. TaxID=1411316 RepID=UPI003D7F60EA
MKQRRLGIIFMDYVYKEKKMKYLSFILLKRIPSSLVKHLGFSLVKHLPFILLSLLSLFPLQQLSAQRLAIVNVQRHGAKGDGVTDDYKALLSAYNAINKQGGGQLYFPKGRYFIKPYHTKDNTVLDLILQDCKMLEIKGDQAIIEVNGAFHRSAEYNRGKHYYSKTSSIIPMALRNCDSVKISGIEIKGQVDKMSKDAGLTESGGHLLTFNHCSRVNVQDVYVHHAQTDGIYINNKSSDFKFNRVRSSNNARQGMSIIELIGGRFENCSFTETGFTGGKYGGHAPQAGVDIEPSTVKHVARDISFYKCEFLGNKGSQFVCSKPFTTTNITLDNCTFAAGKGTYPYQMILTAKNLVIKNSTIDVGKGSIYPVWSRYSGSDVQILNCKISGSGKGIVAVSVDPANKVLLQGNQLTYTGKTLTSYFPYLQMSKLRFIDNQVTIPAASIREGKITSLVQKAEVSSGNVFKSGHQRMIPKVSYEGSQKVRDQKPRP